MTARHRLTIGALLSAGLLGLAGAARDLAAQTGPGREVFYYIFVRSFRDSNGDRVGDLEGIRRELGYLHDLGVTSLLLTPINPSPTYHNYFASSYEGVDSAYGDTAALRSLIAAAHWRGMKIYLDEEIQYAVADNPWWKESQGRPGSPFSHYILYTGPDNTEPASIIYNLTALPTWTGAKIPVTTVNLPDPDVVRYFGDLFATLADPRRYGVDGFRIDHMMDDLDGKPQLTGLFSRFWAPVFARVRAANPRSRVVAEQADWGYGENWLTRAGADWVFAFPLERAIGTLNRDSIASAIAQTRARTPPGKGQLVFLENHDMSRFASRVGGDLRKEKIGAALNVLLEGTPLLYYGQEIGMKGVQSNAWGSDANDIPDREAMKWTAQVECAGCAVWYRDTGPWWTNRYNSDGDGISVADERGDPNSLLSFYRRLLALRRSRPELSSGGERVIGTEQPSVLAVLRSTGAQASLLLENLGDSAVTVAVPRDSLPASLAGGQRRLMDLVSGRAEPASGDVLRVALPAWGIKLLMP